MELTAIKIPIEVQLTPQSRALIDALIAATPAAPAPEEPRRFIVPAIGQAWPGVDGVYAGITRGEDGQPDAHLVLLNVNPTTKMDWGDAKDWAGMQGDGTHLPTRTESALLYANLHDQFDTSAWYWTSTQYDAGNAWSQDFSYGDQYGSYKSYEARVRAVRRFVL
jgi:hypothetical protein